MGNRHKDWCSAVKGNAQGEGVSALDGRRNDTQVETIAITGLDGGRQRRASGVRNGDGNASACRVAEGGGAGVGICDPAAAASTSEPLGTSIEAIADVIAVELARVGSEVGDAQGKA